MARSTYYSVLKKVDAVAEKNKELAKKIIEIFNYHKGRY